MHISLSMLRAIFREWCCQIEHLIQLGIQPTHFDGHHHVHTIPQLIPVLAALRRRYKINKIRKSRNLYGLSERPGRGLLAKKSVFNLALRTVGFCTTRIFTDLQTFVGLCGLRPPAAATAELMTHPGALPRDGEAVLLDEHWPSKLSYDVTLISYKNL